MKKRTRSYADIGTALLAETSDDAKAGRGYLHARGWTDKAIRRRNFRWIEGDEVESLWTSTREFRPLGGVVLPYPNDKQYGVTRVFYPEGTSEDAPKFLTPGGVPLQAYIPTSVSRRRKDMLIIIESPFKAALLVSKGVPCIGVNGRDGFHEAGAHLPTPPTVAQSREYFRKQLLPYLLPGRKVMFVTDADDRKNLDVRSAQLNFLDAANGGKCIPVYRPIPDLGDGRSGIDDYLVEHSVAEWRKLPTYGYASRMVDIMRNPFRDYTEFGMADRFIAFSKADLRYDPKSRQWWCYKEGRWQEGETSGYQAMRATVDSLKDEVAAEKTESRRITRQKEAKPFQSNQRVAASLSVASADKRIHIDAGRFDGNSDLIGVRNGTLNLRTYKLVPAKRSHMISMNMPVEFHGDAEAPLFERFISRACDSDPELIMLVQDIYGATLLGKPNRQEVIFFQGLSSTGKTVAIETIGDALGDYSTATKADLLLRSRQNNDPERPSPFLYQLRGKRLVTCSELPENMPLDETALKDISGGDMIAARDVHKSVVNFRNTARVIIRCNHLPVVTGNHDSVWNRILIVPFNVVIPPEQQDKMLREKIAANELSGVLRWALEGLRRYAKRGYQFEIPENVSTLLAAHRRESDVIGLWLGERWVVDKTKSEAPYVAVQADVTSDYFDWCRVNGQSPLARKSLWSRLRERFGNDIVYGGNVGKMVKGFKPRKKSFRSAKFAGGNVDRTIADQQDKIDELNVQVRDLESNIAKATPPETGNNVSYLDDKRKEKGR